MVRRTPSDQDIHREIHRVRYYIEMCLTGYMTKWEIMDCLARRANIEQAFTRVVYERLEQENEAFFRFYNSRMALRHRTMNFGTLRSSRQHPLFYLPSHSQPLMHQCNGNASHQRPPLPPFSHQHPPIVRPHNALQVSNPNAAQSSREAMQEQVSNSTLSSDDESID